MMRPVPAWTKVPMVTCPNAAGLRFESRRYVAKASHWIVYSRSNYGQGKWLQAARCEPFDRFRRALSHHRPRLLGKTAAFRR